MSSLERDSLSTQIYQKLRDELIEGQHLPGQRLRLADTAKRLGTSPTPVREAIFRLVSEQVLEITAATSITVRVLTLQELQDIQLTRQLLEGAAAERAAELATTAQVANITALHQKFLATARESLSDAYTHNRHFHFAVLAIANMPVLSKVVENMWTLMGPLLKEFHESVDARLVTGENTKHQDIIDAILTRDGESARRAMELDIRVNRSVVEWYSSKLASHQHHQE